MAHQFNEVFGHLDRSIDVFMVTNVVRSGLVEGNIAVPHDQDDLVFIDQVLNPFIFQFGIVILKMTPSPSMKKVDYRIPGLSVRIGVRKVYPERFDLLEDLTGMGQVLVGLFGSLGRAGN